MSALPLLVIAALSAAIALAVARSLRDEGVLESLRAEVRLFGETQRAVCEARAGTARERSGA